MKVLFAGDMHGNTGFVRATARHAVDHHVDVVLQVGDFGFWEHEPAGVRFLDEVSDTARTSGVPWVFVDGNHDNVGLLRRTYTARDEEGFVEVREGLRYAPRGLRWTWAGVSFLAFGGAYSVDKAWRLEEEAKPRLKVMKKNSYRRRAGAPLRPLPQTAETLWFPDEEATDAERDRVVGDAVLHGPVDVMVTHDMPRGANPGWNRKDLPDCYPNQDRVAAVMRAATPQLLVHGHLHYRYTDHVRVSGERWTTVVGLGGDPQTRDDAPGYDPHHAWLVVDLATWPDAVDQLAR